MREIGSEFWEVPVRETETGLFPATVQWYGSGRAALRAVLADRPEIRTAAVPAWCCDSMIAPFLQAGIDVRFYDAFPGTGPVPACDALLSLNYFGYGGTGEEEHPCVIRDVTHSLFSQSRAEGAYTFGSLRKWCGIRTGGFAWAADGHPLPSGGAPDKEYLQLRWTAMEQKARYLEDPAADPEKKYLALFSAAEERLDGGTGIDGADPRDIELAARLDADRIRAARRRNARLLMEAFPEWLLFPELREDDCPLCVPVRVPGGKRDALRRFLIDRQIYCPVHWPLTALHRVSPAAAEIMENELSLVCDQRYNEDDMARIIETVRAFWKEEKTC